MEALSRPGQPPNLGKIPLKGGPIRPFLRIRLLEGLRRPFKGFIRFFKGLIGPLKGLIRPFKGLIGPLMVS